MKPQKGDRILVYKEPWISLILDQRKKMEIRCMPLSAGTYFLGMQSRILGVIKTGAPRHIPDPEAFRALRPLHRVTGSLPYKKTYGLPILHVSRINPPIKYRHTKGAVGIVKYR